jgi:hypothetical protein
MNKADKEYKKLDECEGQILYYEFPFAVFCTGEPRSVNVVKCWPRVPGQKQKGWHYVRVTDGSMIVPDVSVPENIMAIYWAANL